MQKHWWKILSLLLLIFTVIAGFLKKIPYFGQNEETTRNVFFHVPMWFGMIILYTISFIYSILYLSKLNLVNDIKSYSYAKTGSIFGILGLITGMVWARVAWGTYWNNDPKQVGAAICLLIYAAYFVLRGSIKDEDKKGRISAVYNVFAYFLMFPSIYIVPGLMSSLHPGDASSESLMVFKMDSSLRLIFYPAVVGWVLLGVWITHLRYRFELIKEKL